MIPKEYCYLYGKYLEDYLHDCDFCQNFAMNNRNILKYMGWHEVDSFTSVHNYIDTKNKILRKGAISAQLGERVVILINMRDGAIIGRGKGIKEWNYSAPHGACRIMSRTKAFESLPMKEYQKEMNGIYSTSVNEHILDESPWHINPLMIFLMLSTKTIDIDMIIKPVYNFKAN